VSDLPLSLPAALDPADVDALDRPGKIGAALEALGPVADRDVLVVDAEGGPVVRALGLAGARISHASLSRPLRLDAADGSADVVLGLWSAFRGVAKPEVVEVDRVLRPGGRHLVVHEYGRDDVSRLLGARPEYGAWSQRTGPFLTGGFRVRVVHCFWEFETPEATSAFLARVFGEAGERVAATLTRPRLSWNVAVYHRSRP
jgi:hypothetical protein